MIFVGDPLQRSMADVDHYMYKDGEKQRPASLEGGC